MPSGFISLNDVDMKRYRILIFGSPNSGKTTSLKTFVQDNQEMKILSCPGEKGIKSLPTQENIESFIFNVDPEDINVDLSIKIDISINELIKKIASMNISSFAVDGIHKLYDYYLNLTSSGDYLAGERIDIDKNNKVNFGRPYSQARLKFQHFLSKLYNLTIPLIVMTAWDDWDIKEEDERLSQSQKMIAQKYLYPMFPGKLSKTILGEFDAVIYASIQSQCSLQGKQGEKIAKFYNLEPCTEKGEHYIWQLTQRNSVKGVAIKKNHTSYIPPYIHQDFNQLKNIIEG